MNAELEFHDSTLSAIVTDGGSIVVQLRPAYVRCEEDGVMCGYAQDADIRFLGARLLHCPKKMPVWISDGVLKEGDSAIFDALMPIPCLSEKEGSFSGITAEGEQFGIEATAFRAMPVGERRFIEKIR